MKRAVVITASDRVSAGVREDASGIGVGERLEALGFTVQRAVLPDERAMLTEVLRETAKAHDLIVTTGGTGLTPRDVTPQATKDAIDFEVPGLAEAMRAAGRASTPFADLSRAWSASSAGRWSSTCPAARAGPWSRWRRSRACSTTRSRRSPGRTTTTRRIRGGRADA